MLTKRNCELESQLRSLESSSDTLDGGDKCNETKFKRILLDTPLFINHSENPGNGEANQGAEAGKGRGDQGQARPSGETKVPGQGAEGRGRAEKAGHVRVRGSDRQTGGVAGAKAKNFQTSTLVIDLKMRAAVIWFAGQGQRRRT